MLSQTDRESLTQDPKIRAYTKKRADLASCKPVSKEEAMKQILRFSREPRKNVYASLQVNADGKLILKSSLKK